MTRTYPGLLDADIVLTNLAIEKALVTSESAATYSYVPRSNVVLQLSVQGNDGVVDLHRVHGGFGDFEDRFDSIDWMFEAVDRLHEELHEKADGTYCEAGTHDVILDSDLAGILAHEAIGHTCEADLVLGGSVAGDRLGRQVASEKFTLTSAHAARPDAANAIAQTDSAPPTRHGPDRPDRDAMHAALRHFLVDVRERFPLLRVRHANYGFEDRCRSFANTARRILRIAPIPRWSRTACGGPLTRRGVAQSQ